MRLIGHLKNEASAQVFGDYLAGREIKHLAEPEADGTWAVWVYSEDHVAPGRQLLDAYQANPEDPRFKAFAGKAAALKAKEEKAQAAYEKQVRTRHNLWPNARMGKLTLGLIVISVIVGLYSMLLNSDLEDALFFSLPAIRSGQIWRVLTPIFIHFGILHLLFNMLWLQDLGTLIEVRQGTGRLALLVVVLAATSNVAQYLVSGSNFGGMSGVVYGLLGYVWMRGKYDPASGLALHPQIMIMMMIWFVLCMTGLLGQVANTCHAVGLAVGLAWGWLSAVRRGF